VIDGLTRSATDFEKRFRQIRDDYRYTYIEEIGSLLQSPASATFTSKEDELKDKEKRRFTHDVLEYQIRVWVIDGFLRSLNWIQNSTWESKPRLVNMVPEMTVTSGSGTKRRMDYFGYESDTRRPLLVVEAKRPSDELPKLSGGARLTLDATRPSTEVAEITQNVIASQIAKGLRKKTTLSREWPKWLDSLKDYVNSVKSQTGDYPLKVVITNGEWCVIFVDPEKLFASDEDVVPEDVRVYLSTDEILRNAGEIFSLLEHRRVLGKASELTPGEMRFFIDVDQIERLAFGLKLRYEIAPTAGISLLPFVTVVPLVLARSIDYSWIRILGNDHPRPLPDDYTAQHLLHHLSLVQADAESLMSSVRNQLTHKPLICSVEEHYSSPDSFAAQAGVIKSGDCYVLFTGQHTHYFRDTPTVEECRFHDWVACRREGVEQGDRAVYGKWVDEPRAFFESETDHHCAHKDVYGAKHSPITAANRPKIGLRSGQEDFAFCEIAPFEDYLCCRTCIYERVCTSSETLRLPCIREEVGGTNTQLIQLQ
jgi:hypothetical protein